MNFVCVDLDDEMFSALPADTPNATRTMYFSRDNRNHFIPLQPSKIPPRELLKWTGRAAPTEHAAGNVG